MVLWRGVLDLFLLRQKIGIFPWRYSYEHRYLSLFPVAWQARQFYWRCDPQILAITIESLHLACYMAHSKSDIYCQLPITIFTGNNWKPDTAMILYLSMIYDVYSTCINIASITPLWWTFSHSKLNYTSSKRYRLSPLKFKSSYFHAIWLRTGWTECKRQYDRLYLNPQP